MELLTHRSEIESLPKQDRKRGIEIVSKIVEDILSNPDKEEYKILNFNIICNKLSHCKPFIHLLFDAGFIKTKSEQNSKSSDSKLIFDETQIHRLYKIRQLLSSIEMEENNAYKPCKSKTTTINDKYLRFMEIKVVPLTAPPVLYNFQFGLGTKILDLKNNLIDSMNKHNKRIRYSLYGFLRKTQSYLMKINNYIIPIDIINLCGSFYDAYYPLSTNINLNNLAIYREYDHKLMVDVFGRM